MKSTFHQVPNMRGKKEYAFRCGCCWAQNFREEQREFEISKLTFEEIGLALAENHGIRNTWPDGSPRNVTK